MAASMSRPSVIAKRIFWFLKHRENFTLKVGWCDVAYLANLLTHLSPYLAQHDTYTPTEKRIAEEVKIFGIVGYFSLGFASFLIVVTERLLQARLDGRAIWKISNIAVFPIRRNAMLSQDEEDLEAQYLCSLKNVLTCGNVFFSAELDLTNSCQRSKHRMRIPHTTPGEYLNGLDDRYFWNRELLSCFLDSPKTHFFLLPLISGFVGGKNIPKTSTKPELSFLLISRISRYRAGIKSRRKGVDALGHAAVEVESELIAMTVSEIASFVQVRGSVPFFWEEKVSEESTMRTNIEIGIAKSFQSMDAFETHLMRLSRIYGGTITILDLLDRSDSHVAILSDMYEKMTHKFMLADVMSIEYKNFHAVEQRHLLQQGNTLAFMFKQVVPYAIQNYVFPHLSPDSIFRLVHVGVTRQGYYLKSFESEKKQQQGVFRWDNNEVPL